MHRPALPLTVTASRGFTLVELSIVLVIVALLSGGLMMSVGAQIDQRSRSDTNQQLQDIRDALLGYAAAHSAADGKPFLPCPDTDFDGIENRTGAVCTNHEGMLPWADLGLGNQDAWNNRFHYRVDPGFSNRATGMTLTTVGTLKVCEQTACSSTLATTLPAVVLSHGKNGYGAVNSNNAANSAPTEADEIENTNADTKFISHTPTPAGANEFDDLVIWLSPNILYNRMIAAGRLP